MKAQTNRTSGRPVMLATALIVVAIPTEDRAAHASHGRSFYLDWANETVAEGTFVGVFLVRHHATNTNYVPMNNHRQATSESESESHRTTRAVYTKADDIAEGNETRELSFTPTSSVEDSTIP